MKEPTWVNIAADNAFISRSEVMEWIGLTATGLNRAVASGFPHPRVTSFIGAKQRWRVGDIRKWIEGTYAKEKAESASISATSERKRRSVTHRIVDGRRLCKDCDTCIDNLHHSALYCGMHRLAHREDFPEKTKRFAEMRLRDL